MLRHVHSLAITSILVLLVIPVERFLIQSGTPVAIPNFVQPDAGCNWSGVGGQVFDLDGTPMTGLVIRVQGVLEGQQVNSFAVTGNSVKFGSGGYEIMFTNRPVATQGSLNLQLMDLSGKVLSARLPLTTYATCEQNLLLVNLVKKSVYDEIFFPVIYDR